LIESLVGDLSPVRPVPRMRSAFAVILAVWAAMLGVVLWTKSTELTVGAWVRSETYLVSFFGLMLAALGGTISALSAGVPGRERLELGASATASVGLLAAAIACLAGMRAAGLEASETVLTQDGICFRHGVYLSLLPAGVIVSFLVRGWALHPFRAAGIACVASGALGAVIVHLSCNLLSPRHLLIGHLSVPIVLALLGLYPLALILRRVRG
jgi:hypothetical protein